LYAAKGRLIPFNSNSPTGSTFTALSTAASTRGLMSICPAFVPSFGVAGTRADRSFRLLVCNVRDVGVLNNFGIQTGHASMYRALNGVELVVDDVNDPHNRAHLLQFFLCRHTRVIVTVRSGRDSTMPVPEPTQDIELAIVPLYRQMLKHLIALAMSLRCLHHA
jgi:hypothetical protein